MRIHKVNKLEKFICAHCHKEFETEWTDDEAQNEFQSVFGKSIDVSQHVIVCDDCYKMIMQMTSSISN